MTLPTWVKTFLKQWFPAAWSFVHPEHIGVVMTCMMQFVKAPPPPHVTTVKQVLWYFRNKIVQQLDGPWDIAVCCFDTKSPEVKQIVCHKKRYAEKKLCKVCAAGVEKCEKDCEAANVQMRFAEGGPHLPLDDDARLPDGFFDSKGNLAWQRYSADSENLRYDLYPRVVNLLLRTWNPPPGKVMFLHGLPFKTRVVKEVEGAVWDEAWVKSGAAGEGFDRAPGHSGAGGHRVILDHWTEGDSVKEYESLIDPDLFYRVYRIEHNLRREEPGMFNRIHEADNAIFFFSRFFRHIKRHLHRINDGDAISIGLLVQHEDEGALEHFLALPNREVSTKALGQTQFVDLARMHREVYLRPDFVAAKLQNPVATMVFLIICAETDFFDQFCPGINNQLAWDVFMKNLDRFSHLIQCYCNERSVETERHIYIDPDGWREFVHLIYTTKYKQNNFSDVLVHCSKHARKPPTDERIRRWGRQVLWNAEYWVNAFRNKYPDPFRCVDGVPVYGYEKDKEEVSDRVSESVGEVDEVASRHWVSAPRLAAVQQPPKLKGPSALEKIKGK